MTDDHAPIVNPTATGDDALAAGMTLVQGTSPASDLDLFDNQTRDYVANGYTFWKPSLAPLPVAKGGTGSTTAQSARSALGVTPENLSVWKNSGATAAGTTPSLGWNGRRLQYEIPGYVNPTELANIGDVPTGGGGLADGPTSAAYNRGPGGSNYFTVWMNQELQFFRNTSSLRYKQNVRDWDGSVLGLRPVMFDRRGENAPTDEVGLIAEEVQETLPDAVAYFDGQIDGIHDRVVLVALICEVQRLAARVQDLETRGAGS
jgi:hypothetical protein